jgi:hypothetical protein
MSLVQGFEYVLCSDKFESLWKVKVLERGVWKETGDNYVMMSCIISALLCNGYILSAVVAASDGSYHENY